MPSAKNALEPAPVQDGPASRYEAVIRLGEAIRSHPDEKDLFRTLVNELHEVVEFDVLGSVRQHGQLGPVVFCRAL